MKGTISRKEALLSAARALSGELGYAGTTFKINADKASLP